MASEVMLALTPAPAASIREMDDVRDMVRSVTVTTIYVSGIFCVRAGSARVARNCGRSARFTRLKISPITEKKWEFYEKHKFKNPADSRTTLKLEIRVVIEKIFYLRRDF